MMWLTTGEGAQLVNVHQSSIKRWCDEGLLACSRTEGGHRRIELQDLLSLANKEKLNCRLLTFGPQAETIYAAANLSQSEDDYTALIELVYSWLKNTRRGATGQLLRFLYELGVSMPEVCDRLIAPILNRMGREWTAGIASIGDEHRMYYLILEAYQELRIRLLQEHVPDESGPASLVACGEGNRHEMGALMVRLCLELQRVPSVYLGSSLPVEEIALQQQKLSASIVCVSLPPPSVSSDVERTLRILARTYDDERPFSLLIGGRAVDGMPDVDETDYPFVQTRLLNSVRALHAWLEMTLHAAS